MWQRGLEQLALAYLVKEAAKPHAPSQVPSDPEASWVEVLAPAVGIGGLLGATGVLAGPRVLTKAHQRALHGTAKYYDNLKRKVMLENFLKVLNQTHPREAELPIEMYPDIKLTYQLQRERLPALSRMALMDRLRRRPWLRAGLAGLAGLIGTAALAKVVQPLYRGE